MSQASLDVVLGEPSPPSALLERGFRYEDGRLMHELSVPAGTFETSVSIEGGKPPADPLGEWWKAYLRGEQLRVDTPNQAPPLRIAELFCGPGGLALGVGRACDELGFRRMSVAAADQDEEALAVYRRWNRIQLATSASVSSLVDYRVEGNGDEAEFLYEPEVVDPAWGNLASSVDLLLAGPPCQGHSNLNNKTRYTDRRNHLYLTVPAMAVAVNARAVIIENVRNVIHDRRQVVQSAETLLLKAGYHLTKGVVRAARLGWPQGRERFFIVARRDRAPLPLEAVADALAANPRDIWWAIGDLETQPADGYMTQHTEFSEENRRRIDWLFENEAYDLPPSERPECHREGTTYNAVYGRLYADRPAPTITSGFMTAGRGRFIHPTQRRVLTPREAARLQGFPDTYDFRPNPPAVPTKLKLGKWIGDAVPMPLGYAAALAALGSGWD